MEEKTKTLEREVRGKKLGVQEVLEELDSNNYVTKFKKLKNIKRKIKTLEHKVGELK